MPPPHKQVREIYKTCYPGFGAATGSGAYAPGLQAGGSSTKAATSSAMLGKGVAAAPPPRMRAKNLAEKSEPALPTAAASARRDGCAAAARPAAPSPLSAGAALKSEGDAEGAEDGRKHAALARDASGRFAPKEEPAAQAAAAPPWSLRTPATTPGKTDAPPPLLPKKGARPPSSEETLLGVPRGEDATNLSNLETARALTSSLNVALPPDVASVCRTSALPCRRRYFYFYLQFG